MFTGYESACNRHFYIEAYINGAWNRHIGGIITARHLKRNPNSYFFVKPFLLQTATSSSRFAIRISLVPFPTLNTKYDIES